MYKRRLYEHKFIKLKINNMQSNSVVIEVILNITDSKLRGTALR